MTGFAEGTVIVTGAASERGIGRALARRLAADGRPLALLDRDAAGIEDAAAELEGLGATVLGRALDITDDDAMDRVVAEIESALPPVTGLANIAGVSDPTPFAELDRARWERTIGINLTGTFLMCKRIVPGMIERGAGSIVCLSSTAAHSGGGHYSTTAYAAAKAGIEGLVRGLAREVAPAGVRVNAVAPAMIDTDIMGGPILDDRLPAFVSAVPLGRLGTADEVAALVAFLLGPDAAYITGSTYNINGGVRIG